MSRARVAQVCLCTAIAILSGCGDVVTVLSVQDGGAGATAAGPGVGASNSTVGVGGAGADHSGGAAGDAGSGGETLACNPGEEAACYTGPDGSDGVGECKPGTKLCDDAGTRWSSCAGQVLPTNDLCITPNLDEDCDDEPAGCGDGSFRWLESARILGARRLENGTFALAGQKTVGDPWLGGPEPPAPPGSTHFVARISETVELLEFAWLGPTTAPAKDRALDDAGNYFVVGAGPVAGDLFAGETLSKINGKNPTYLARVTKDGELSWLKQFAGALLNSAIATGGDGSVVLAGAFQSLDLGEGPLIPQDGQEMVLAKFSSDGGLVWMKTVNERASDGSLVDVAVDAGGNIIVAHVVTLPSPDNYQVVNLRKYTSAGDEQWSRFLDPEDVVSSDPKLAVDNAGNILLAFKLVGILDFNGLLPPIEGFTPWLDPAVVKFDANGNPLWSQHFGTPTFYSDIFELELDASGSAHIMGFVSDEVVVEGSVYQWETSEPIAFTAELVAETGQVDWLKFWEGDYNGGNKYDYQYFHLELGSRNRHLLFGYFDNTFVWDGVAIPELLGKEQASFLATLEH